MATKAHNLTLARIDKARIDGPLTSFIDQNRGTTVGALNTGRVVLYESFLSYLGLGIQPPTPSWGK